MKKLLALSVFLFVAGAAWAFSPSLSNEDGKTYKYQLECIGTTHSSINSSTTTYLRGGCKLIVEGAGSAMLEDNMKCVIKNGALKCTK